MTNSITKDLLSEGPSYSLFQAIRLIRHLLSGPTGPGPEALRFRTQLSLGFPASGVAGIDEGKNGGFTVTTPVLGLYGPGSPLPSFYTEDLFTEAAAGDRTVRDMLDVVNHRLLLLLFEAWTKHRSMVRVLEEGNLGLLTRFHHLVGLDRDRLSRSFDNPDTLLKYSGLFAMSSRSASGLETLLSDALNLPVAVVQMTERAGQIPDDQRARLGMNVILGQASSLGSRVHGKGGAFRIEVGPVSTEAYLLLTPGSRKYRLLVSLADLYVASPLDYEVDIVMDRSEKPLTACLGGERFSLLGLDTWVFSGSGPDEFRTRFKGRDTRTM